MKQINIRGTKSLTKDEHGPNCACSICGSTYKSFAFKNGYVCESCKDYMQELYDTDQTSKK